MFTYPEAANLHQRIIRGSEDQKRYERDKKSMEDSVQFKGLS